MNPTASSVKSSSSHPFHLLCKPFGPVCNLACDYCFYLDKDSLFPGKGKSDFRMDDSTLELFTRNYIEAQPPGAQEVNFAWQGGEPTLLGIDFFRRALELQKKYRRQGLKISNAIQTNGTLINEEWARFFKDENFLVGISIDGPEKLHDRFRRAPSGKGSFTDVIRGVELLNRFQVDFNTLTVVQSDNGDHPKEVYRFLKEIGSTFLQFIPIVEPLAKGGVSARTVRPRQWGRFLSAVFHIWREEDIGRIFVQHFDLLLGLWMGAPSSLCVHSPYCGRALAIEHDGSLYSCDHFVDPAHRLGNIHETSLVELVDSPFQMQFGRDKSELLPEECRSCPYLKLCYGGCPSDRCRESRSGKRELNWSCEGYRLFYEDSATVFRAMAEALRRGETAVRYKAYLSDISSGIETGGSSAPVLGPRSASASGPGSAPGAGFASGASPAPAPGPGPGERKKRVGRNDPCPCGSGKKYKQCCGK
jgi:uncharacterized protein